MFVDAVVGSGVSLSSQTDLSQTVATGTLLIFPSVVSDQYASLALPSAPIQRSPVVQYANKLFIGCKAPSYELGDIVAVDIRVRRRPSAQRPSVDVANR